MFGKYILAMAMFIVGCISTPLLAMDQANKDDQYKNAEKKSMIQESNENLPEWAKRIDLNIHTQARGSKPQWTVETIQPLYQTTDTLRHTAFCQLCAAHQNSDETYNAGIGYRYLTPSEKWLGGIDGFYDATAEHGHQRISGGLELISPFLTLRGSVYHVVSVEKDIGTVGGVVTQERALNGRDAEAELVVPFLPWARLVGSYYYWNGDRVDNLEGRKVGALMNITDNLTFEVGNEHNDLRSYNYAIFTMRLGAPHSVEHTMLKDAISKKAFKSRSLRNLVLEKVRSTNDVLSAKRYLNPPV